MLATAPTSSTASASKRRGDVLQPLHAAQIPDALLKLQTVCALTGLSRATIFRKTAAGSFPQPARLGTRCTRWRAGDVTAWLAKTAANVQPRGSAS